MKSLVIILGLFVFDLSAHASANTAPGPLVQAERSVGKLAGARSTPAFEAGFKESVTLIKKLYGEGSATEKVDAQDLAMTAFHFYMDHHRITLGTDKERDATAKKIAADAGLLDVLGW